MTSGMHAVRHVLCLGWLLAGWVATAPAQPPKPFAWETATPESQGMSREKLEALKEELAQRKTHGLLVIRNDRIVFEWYAAGHGATKKHGAASLSKPTVAGLALALLLGDGKLKLDTLVADLIPAWRDDERKRKITLRQLGSHTSGLADAEQDEVDDPIAVDVERIGASHAVQFQPARLRLEAERAAADAGVAIELRWRLPAGKQHVGIAVAVAV